MTELAMTGTEFEGVAWSRLEDQLAWYDAKSVACQRTFKRVKAVQLVLGSAVPVLAFIDLHAALTAGVAAIIVVLEGLQQLNQWQANWILYRSTAEALKHERYLFLAHAGPYRRENREEILAEKVEGLVSQEHAKWTESHEAASYREPTRSEPAEGALGG
ncbi:MAG TPA: DUF4231 domain-containing protein [Nocardioidaceae bacterium]|nr:DUF4231 domain-containing protein [Nocardioidaceae bacterium]